MKDFSHHFRELIERELPSDPRVLILDGDQDLMILATWRLGTDALRPNKRSRLVRIHIAQEALEDCARGSDGTRMASNSRFTAWLRRQLNSFDPNHDSPLGVDPSPVLWPLSTLDLNG